MKGINPINCPACGTKTETFYFCNRCWFAAPAKDRVKLGNMHFKRQDTSSKVASMIPKIKAKLEAAKTS